jgi:hypothetical protein
LKPVPRTRKSVPAPDLFGYSPLDASHADHTSPQGLRYVQEAMDSGVERELVAKIQNLPFQPFLFHGHEGNRRVVSFGYQYDFTT